MGIYTACICEGEAERAILNILLDNHKLIFEREDLIEEEILKCRKGADFAKRYLSKEFKKKITVYRVLDSRTENFNVGKAYEDKIEVKNVITAPEIEMLIICNEGKYKEYQREKRKNSDLKPNTFCKAFLGYKNVKQYEFVKEYFKNTKTLIDALHEYRRISKPRPNEMFIWDLLKKSD